MITNNSYIRSDYGIINKNIIAQTKLDEYNKESNKNFLTTKEYVDSKIVNNVNICYTIDNPYVYEIKEENNQKYIENISGDYDIDGKIKYGYINDYGYYIGRYVENNIIIYETDYKLIKVGQEKQNKYFIIEENDIHIGQEFYSKFDQEIYKFVMYYIEYNNSYNKTIIFTPINIYLNIDKQNEPKEEIYDLLIFNINNNILYHNVMINTFDNLNNNNFNINLNNDETIYKKENEMIKTTGSTTTFYFDNEKPINNFYNYYLFLSIKKLNSDYIDKELIGNEKIINYYSYSGIPKITIDTTNNKYDIQIPNTSGNFNTFSLSNNYINLKKEDFYIVLEKYNENSSYIYYKGEIELNNNGIIETNIIDIKYDKSTYKYEDNNSEFISSALNNDLQFILINYDKKCVLNIQKEITTENNTTTIDYKINKFDDNKITDTIFYKDLTLLINLNIKLNIIDEFKDVKFEYEFNLLSSPNEQRVKYWENNNKYITISSLFNYYVGES